MKEFFGFGGYQREPEGYFSWQHILFVSVIMAIMAVAAVILGRKYKKKDEKAKNRVLIVSTIALWVVEIIKNVVICARSDDANQWLYLLPLFFCSIQLITLPLAAFSKGRIKESALDFVFIFGLLCAVLGTYMAGNNYSSYPVLCFDNLVSGITHAIAGFASLYIVISGMQSMNPKNIPITCAIIIPICSAAIIANHCLDYNYMFLKRGDGTPYDIIYNWVGGNKVLYPMLVILLFLIYIVLFYLIYRLITSRKKRV